MNRDFRVFSICLVKNEGDIIEHCLREASKWSDRIIVYDGESEDGTWEKVVAMRNHKIIPWKREDKVFREGLRAEAFNEFRHESREGDWWCRLDADEFYVVSPKEFLAQVQPPDHVVWGIALEYSITEDDLGRLDFSRPCEELLPELRYYQAHNSEPRFFRYRKRLEWPESASWPLHMGLAHRNRIMYRHYKYRSPTQISRRLSTRQAAVARGAEAKSYLSQKHWREKIGKAEDFSFDRQNGHFEIQWSRLPDPVEPLHRRVLKHLMHGSGIWP